MCGVYWAKLKWKMKAPESLQGPVLSPSSHGRNPTGLGPTRAPFLKELRLSALMVSAGFFSDSVTLQKLFQRRVDISKDIYKALSSY